MLTISQASAVWLYQSEITVTSTQSTPATDFQILVELNPGNFDYSHANADGSDLRFASAPFTEVFDISYYIETWDPGGTSRVWAKVPSIPALSTTSIYLRYGNSAAASAADFSSTFPNAFISTGADTLGGAQAFDWFEVRAGDMLTVTAGAPLQINARAVIISGTVDAGGAGSTAGAASSDGNGPGGGQTSTDAGSGGGGYGGDGGIGGYDAGDTPGAGGVTYGTEAGTDLAMGSGGGSSATTLGGNGGGAVSITAQDVEVSGTLTVDGADAFDPGGPEGGGGGSGGGLIVMAFNLTFDGAISARGGKGATGTSTANDGGGGGGGGRIKLFAEGSLLNAGTMDAGGGDGGLYGNIAYGEAGIDGTTHADTTTIDFEEITASVGAEVTLEPVLNLSRLRRFPSTEVGRKSRPRMLKLTNSGQLELKISAIRIKGSGAREFQVKRRPKTLAAGASTRVPVRFKPKKTGIRKAKLKVRSNVPAQTVRLVGKGTPSKR